MAFSFKKCSVSWCSCRITWTRSVRCRRKLGWKKSISSANWWSWTLEETYSGDDFATGVHFIQNGRGVRSKIIKVLIQIRLTNGQQPNISAEFFYCFNWVVPEDNKRKVYLTSAVAASKNPMRMRFSSSVRADPCIILFPATLWYRCFSCHASSDRSRAYQISSLSAVLENSTTHNLLGSCTTFASGFCERCGLDLVVVTRLLHLLVLEHLRLLNVKSSV